MTRAAPLSFAKSRPPIRDKGRGARSNDSGRFEGEQREEINDGWRSTPPEDFKTSVTLETPRTIINKVQSDYVNFDRSINPYRGCEHGCVYCFARPTHAYYGLSSGIDFEAKLFAKPDAAKLLTKELSQPNYKVRPIMIGTNTDAYQPIERRFLIMRSIIKTLSLFNHPVSILTKGQLIMRDLDILGPLGQRNLTRCMVSITTQDRHLARAMEPRAATPAKRFEAIERMVNAGIPTGVMLGPMIPGLNDNELEGIMEKAANKGASFAAYTIIRLPYEIKQLWREWLEAYAPNRATRIIRHIRDMNGGKDYDPNWSRSTEIKGTYAKLIAQRFRKARQRFGLNTSLPRLDCSQFRVPTAITGQMDLFF